MMTGAVIEKGIAVDVALAWQGKGSARVIAFANQSRSSLDSSHVVGFWDGIREALVARFGEDVKQVRPTVLREVLSEGLVAVLDVKLRDPVFASPVRDRLRSPEAREVTRTAVSAAMKRKLDSDELFAGRLAERFNPAGRCAPPARRSRCT
jgi:DNA gyrase subunit B